MGPIYIMWLRQLKRYFRSRARMIGSLGQPLIFLLAFGFGFGHIYSKAGNGDYLQFLAPGVISMAVLFTAVFSGIELIWDRQFGFLKETLVAPVSRLSIMIGRTLGGATVAMLQGTIVLLISLLFGFRPNFQSILISLLFMFLIALLFTALGTALASQLNDMQSFPPDHELFSHAPFLFFRRDFSTQGGYACFNPSGFLQPSGLWRRRFAGVFWGRVFLRNGR